MRSTPILVLGLALVSPVSAHHSDAALNMESVVTMEGTVTELSLRNPHSYFSVETINEAGEAVEWNVQMGSAIASRRRGWTPDTLAVGERVTFSAHPSKNGRPYSLFVSLQNADGVDLPIVTEPESERTAAARASTLEGRWIVDESSLVDYPDGFDQLTRRDLTLTEKASVALAAYDDNSIADNPLLSCVGRSTPGPIIYTDLYPMEFVFNDDRTITIRSQFFDNVRTVYMDGRGHPPPGERYLEGHSIGHWEGDVLVVDTRNFTDHRSPYQNGIPSGAQKHVVERYQLAEDGTRLAVEFTLADSEYIVGSMTHRRELRYVPQMDMEAFDCDLESTQRYMPE